LREVERRRYVASAVAALSGPSPEEGVETIRVVCAHDCPDMCSLLAHVEDGRITRIAGDPDQPFTAGFACAKVNRDAELVHSPERLATPLRRVGAKGEGKFSAIGWDEALDEIVARWQAIIAESGRWRYLVTPTARIRGR
jgi:anaerobic selenocysteine-containing dehydrogenase